MSLTKRESAFPVSIEKADSPFDTRQFRALQVLKTAEQDASKKSARRINFAEFQAIISLLAHDEVSAQRLIEVVSARGEESAWIASRVAQFGYGDSQCTRESFRELRCLWPVAKALAHLPQYVVRDSGLTPFALQQIGITDVPTARTFAKLWLSVKEPGYVNWFDCPDQIEAVKVMSRWPVINHLPDEALKPLFWHYLQTGEDLSAIQCRQEIEEAGPAWFVEPALPRSIARRVGSLEPSKRLAAAVAWETVSTETLRDGTETSFWHCMDELATLRRSQLVARLSGLAVLPAAVEAVHGKLLSQQSQAELVSALKTCPQPFNMVLELKAPEFVEALQLLRDSGYGGWGNEDQLHKRHAVALAAIFKGGWRTWLRVQRQLERSIHDATYWLPLAAGEAIRGLGPFLFNNSDRRLNELEMISARWSELDAEMRSQPFEAISLHVRSITYPEARDRHFGAEAARWGISASVYYEIERRYLSSLPVPVPFATDGKWKYDELTGHFLERKDPRGLFLGQHTNCCQHPQGVGRECAWNGQESARAGFFVVEDKAGEIIAQSWTWISDTGALVFDNVESKGLGRREAAVKNIYCKAADDLADTFGLVLLGTGRSKMGVDDFAPAGNDTQPLPSGYDGYSDAGEQVVLARSEKRGR